MPVQAYTLRKGTEQKSILIHAWRGKDRATGLSVESPGIKAAYGRDDGTVQQIHLVAGTDEKWAPGGFTEVDAAMLPGVYRLDLPDEALTAGATRAVVVVQAEDAVFHPIDIDLVAFDQQDSHSMGMVALTNEARTSCLTAAFPILAKFEQEHAGEAST